MLHGTATRPRREAPEAFLELPLVVHSVLADVPLHDVTIVDLPGGGGGRRVAEVRDLMGGSRRNTGTLTRTLFAVRRSVGRLLHWDEGPHTPRDGSYRDRVDDAVLRRSAALGADAKGVAGFVMLYELENESLQEVRNATVHAFLSLVLVPRDEGYRLYFAVYVKPVSGFTSLYMAIIEPFRRFVVYPSVLGGLRRAWAERYGASPGGKVS